LETLTVTQARRLALVRAGLLKPELTNLRTHAKGAGRRARERCHTVIDRFGYLQLDTVSVAGARSHAIVLASRLSGFDAALAERLLEPGEPLFEYWGHEASWIPLSLYPCFAFRRREYRVHPWWGDLLSQHVSLKRRILQRVAAEGPIRSVDLEGASGAGWWDPKLSKRILEALWSAGELAVRERRNFQRSFDFPERVIADSVRGQSVEEGEALERLLLRALEGHGWATQGTLAATWRLRNRREALQQTLRRLTEAGKVLPCSLRTEGRDIVGWIRPQDLEMLSTLESLRPRRNTGILLSPFDPILWDRNRTQQLFDFEQVLEIYKPEQQRRFGYYCLPVLAGERLVARVDLKAERTTGSLRVRACHHEHTNAAGKASSGDQEAVASALRRYSDWVGLTLALTP
jgi:hypothetical protein